MSVKCTICGRSKKPIGRDSRDNGLCDHDCEGYRLPPTPSAYWDSELFDKDFISGLEAAREIAKKIQPHDKDYMEDVEQDVRDEGFNTADRIIKMIEQKITEAKG